MQTLGEGVTLVDAVLEQTGQIEPEAKNTFCKRLHWHLGLVIFAQAEILYISAPVKKAEVLFV